MQNKENTIHEMIMKQAEKRPSDIALEYHEKSMTYGELNERSNQLAAVLKTYGVGPESIVGLMTDRSFDMYIGILGILKAGGAYLPIDSNLPENRVRYMLDDCGCNLIVTQKQFETKVSPCALPYLLLESEELTQVSTANPEITTAKPEDMAYIIYTSGSTGKPKGVMIEHRSVINFIYGMADFFDFTQGKKTLGITTISFDIFVLESIVPLALGGTVLVTDKAQQEDLEEFAKLLAKTDILQTTPSLIQMTIQEDICKKALKNIGTIIIGGEPFPKELLNQLKPFITGTLWNAYGPTETTVWSMMKELTQVEEVTIGRPVLNTRIYILGENNEECGVNQAGELCIAGDGMARGYFGREELTNERFIDNPFENGGKLYRTGDLAKWREDGEIDFIGRMDYQVKIRGFRIELGEIETELRKSPYIESAVVDVRKNNLGEKILCAYLVAPEACNPEGLKEALRANLPEYMVPQFYTFLETLPLNTNGKVDKKALADPEFNTAPYEAPANDLEEEIARLWRELLNFDKIGRKDDFFELGGHSLLAMKMGARIYDTFQVKLNLGDLLEHCKTIAGTAQFIEETLLDEMGDEDLSGMMEELDNLSEEELSELLAMQ